MTQKIGLGLPSTQAPFAKQPQEQPKESSSSEDQKTQEVFAAKKPAAAQRSGGSDDELADPMSKMAVFHKQRPILVEEMTIQCRDEKGAVKNVKGSTLIEIVHDYIQKTYHEVVELACADERGYGASLTEPTVDNHILLLKEAHDWIATLGGWKEMMPSQEVQDYYFSISASKRKFRGVRIFESGVIFPIINGRLHITEGCSIFKYDVTTAWKKVGQRFEKDPDGRTDLSYNQIIKALEHIQTSFQLTDSALATIQLCLFNNAEKIPSGIWKNTPKKNQEEILLFLHYLNCLMFGIEASGLNAAIIISLMTLDLIKDESLDYTTVFKANQDGGVYPYACFGDNSGTYSKREQILLHKKEKRSSKSMKEYRDNPSLSPVAVKEAMLIREWLRVNKVFSGDKLYDLQVAEIKKAVDDIANRYFLPGISNEWFLEKFKKQSENILSNQK